TEYRESPRGIRGQWMGRERNQRLIAVMEEAGSTPGGLARSVCDLSRAQGMTGVRCDGNDVRRWRAGRRPRDPKPAIIAEVLGGMLSRHISPADIGMEPAASATVPLEVPADAGLAQPWTAIGAVSVAAEVVKASVLDRRVFVMLSGSALTQPALEWLLASPADDLTSRAGRQIPARHLEAVEQITAQLRRMDDQLGGGAVLDMARSQLRPVIDLLRDCRYDGTTGMRLHGAAAELLQVAGWSCWDSGQNPAAQRYWLAALRAAHAAGERAVGAYVLGLMSMQANFAGRPAEAVRLSEASLHGYRRESP